jgi:hypothetical protein
MTTPTIKDILRDIYKPYSRLAIENEDRADGYEIVDPAEWLQQQLATLLTGIRDEIEAGKMFDGVCAADLNGPLCASCKGRRSHNAAKDENIAIINRILNA